MTLAHIKKRISWYLDNWAIPPGMRRVQQRYQFHKKNHLSNEESKILSRNKALQNCFKGRRCFVIGNGPSLKQHDLLPLGNEVTVVMNHFYAHPVLKHWSPTVHCAGDPSGDYWLHSLERMLTEIHSDYHLLRLSVKPFVDKLNIDIPENIRYTKAHTDIFNWPQKCLSLDLTQPLPRVQNTSILAVELALAMGCSPIYLLGLDYDYLSHRSMDRHFYEAKDSSFKPVDLGATSFEHQMMVCLNIWRCHETLKQIAETRGQEIINITEGGFLDVYPLGKYCDCFEKVTTQVSLCPQCG